MIGLKIKGKLHLGSPPPFQGSCFLNIRGGGEQNLGQRLVEFFFGNNMFVSRGTVKALAGI